MAWGGLDLAWARALGWPPARAGVLRLARLASRLGHCWVVMCLGWCDWARVFGSLWVVGHTLGLVQLGSSQLGWPEKKADRRGKKRKEKREKKRKRKEKVGR